MTNALNYPKTHGCASSFSAEEVISNHDAAGIGRHFLDAARESRIHYKTSGHHVTHDEVDQWVKDLENNPLAAPPLSHT